jgi:hypothetical protein
MKTFFRLMLVCCSFFLATHQVQSQTRYIELSIQNITQPSATEIEYEVWVKNNSPADVAKLCFLQYGMDLPIGLSGGGTLSISKVAWDPAFNGTPWGQAGIPMITGQPNDPTIRVASQTGNSSIAVTIPTTGNGIMYGRYKITNSIPFPANTYLFFDVVKNSSPSTKTRTSVSAYLNGSMSPSAYTYLGSLFYIDSLFVLGNAPLPTFTINPTANICPTYITQSVSNATCATPLGSVDIGLFPAPTLSSGTYTINGNPGGSYTTNPFSVSGLAPGTYTISISNDPGCVAQDIVVTVQAPVLPQTLITNYSLPTCTPGCDGLAHVGSVQGLPPFTFTITGPVTVTNSVYLSNLCANSTYTVLTTDAGGCTESVQVTVPASPSLYSTTVDTCNSYTWNINNQTYTQSGTYTANVIHPLTLCPVTEELILNLNYGTSSNTSVMANGAFVWPCNGSIYTQSGIYTCYTTNAAGCPDTQSIQLTICNVLALTSNYTSCPNTPVTLVGTPPGGVFSIPNPYVGPTTSFTYVYTEPLTGCSDTATGLVEILAPVQVNNVYVNGITATSAVVSWQLVPGAVGYDIEYRLMPGGAWTQAGSVLAPVNTYTLTGLSATSNYQVRVRSYCDINNPDPWGTAVSFTTLTLSGLAPDLTWDFEVFPNPAQNQLTIRHFNQRKITQIRILDLSGRMVLESYPASNTSNHLSIDLRSLSPGMYQVQCLDVGQVMATRRFTRE